MKNKGTIWGPSVQPNRLLKDVVIIKIVLPNHRKSRDHERIIKMVRKGTLTAQKAIVTGLEKWEDIELEKVVTTLQPDKRAGTISLSWDGNHLNLANSTRN